MEVALHYELQTVSIVSAVYSAVLPPSLMVFLIEKRR